jgi:hypothetical protein
MRRSAARVATVRWLRTHLAPRERDGKLLRVEDRGGGSGTECLVKGAWFVTARRVLVADHGEPVLTRVASRLGEEHAEPLLSPLASAWYPETAFQRALDAVCIEACGGAVERYCQFIESCAVVGISRFLRVLLSLTSPSYVLSKMPVFWARHRCNNGTLRVELGPRTARLQYEGFPFFDDRNYRVMVRGILCKTLELTSGERPDVTVRDYTRDGLVVDVFFRTLRLRDGV